MGIFSGLFRSRDKPKNRTSGSAYTFYTGRTTAGKAVTQRSAMQMTAVYSCVRILSEAIASLPLHLYRYTDSGGKEKATDSPLYFLLHDEPNPEMTSFVFREAMMTHLLLWGNAYAQIIRNGKGEVTALYPLMPDRMTVDRDENGRLYYEYIVSSDDAPINKKSTVRLQPFDVLHIPGLGFDGLVGYSPIAMAKNAKVWETAKSFVDTHEDKNGLLSAEDTATYNKMEKEIEDLTAAIDRQQRAAQREAELNKPLNSPLTNKPYKGEQSEKKSGRATDEYKNAMLSAMRSNFRNISNVLQEGVDADGGYLVPEEYDSRLIDVLEEENIMRSLATRITTSGQHKINIAATKPAAAWIEEGGALSFGDATFDQIYLDAYKLHVAIKVTEELLYDNAFNLENYIITQFGKALGNAEEDAFLNGDGKGKPIGIFDAKGGGNVLGTLTAAIKSDDMLDLVYGLKRPYRKSSSFIMNDSTLALLRKLKDNNGAYIWQPSYKEGEPDRVLGYAVNTSPYAPTNAIAFGDYSYYNIGDRGSRSFGELRELFAGNGMVGFVAKERVDGKLILPEAVQILKLKETTSAG